MNSWNYCGEISFAGCQAKAEGTLRKRPVSVTGTEEHRSLRLRSMRSSGRAAGAVLPRRRGLNDLTTRDQSLTI